jgi:Transposase IS66 family
LASTPSLVATPEHGALDGLSREWLKPIYAEMKAQMMSGPYLQVDETPIRYLDPGNGKTGQGYLWVAHRPGGDVIYEWHTTRAASCLERLIPIDFKGTVQCDGYSAYDRFANRREREGQPLILAGCWAHVRRVFLRPGFRPQRSRMDPGPDRAPLPDRSTITKTTSWPRTP